MRILITGGTGLIGRQLCALLLAGQHEVSVLSRTPRMVPARCGAKVRAMASLTEWTPEVAFDAIVNLAGAPIVAARWSERRKHLLRDSRIALTEALVNAIGKARHKPAVLLSGSATGYYGDGGDTPMTETSGHGADFGAGLCLDWERMALRAQGYGVRVVLLRTGLVLHPSGGLLGRMLLPFKLGLGAQLGDGRQWMSWIHMRDYLALMLRLLDQSGATGAFNMTAPEPVTNAEFTATMARVLQRPTLIKAPAALLRLGLGEMSELLIGGQRVLPTKAQAIGYRFSFPKLEDALRDLLR